MTSCSSPAADNDQQVRPASTYTYRVQRRGGKVAVFNLEHSQGTDRADFVFRGPCEVQLPRIFPELSELQLQASDDAASAKSSEPS
jgi:hypothetical protein